MRIATLLSAVSLLVASCGMPAFAQAPKSARNASVSVVATGAATSYSVNSR